MLCRPLRQPREDLTLVDVSAAERAVPAGWLGGKYCGTLDASLPVDDVFNRNGHVLVYAFDVVCPLGLLRSASLLVFALVLLRSLLLLLFRFATQSPLGQETNGGTMYPDNPVELPELGGHWVLLRRDPDEVSVVAKMAGMDQRASVSRMSFHAQVRTLLLQHHITALPLIRCVQGVHKISKRDVASEMSQKELMDAFIAEHGRARAAFGQIDANLPIIWAGHNSDVADVPGLFSCSTPPHHFLAHPPYPYLTCP